LTPPGEIFPACHLYAEAASHGQELIVQTEKELVEIDCREVWKEITNYIESDLTPEMRERVDRHLRECPHCKAVYDGSLNVVRLLGGNNVLELPTGFSQRLHDRLLAKIAHR
jgi:hypothetical protein